jgi:hypothetical protein
MVATHFEYCDMDSPMVCFTARKSVLEPLALLAASLQTDELLDRQTVSAVRRAVRAIAPPSRQDCVARADERVRALPDGAAEPFDGLHRQLADHGHRVDARVGGRGAGAPPRGRVHRHGVNLAGSDRRCTVLKAGM